ncbi:MAG TPA: VOC family protein [Baekduia sp.]|nr:VOC family protein [Baekduia sp.]
MALEGIHHVTAITADAPANVEFYVGVLGLRLIKKTVNFDAPEVYHLYYGDEQASAGAAMTFFEFPGTPRGVAGAGMVHTVAWRVGSPAALDFWAERFDSLEIAATRTGEVLRFADPEGMALELHAVAVSDPPLVGVSSQIPAEHALQGFHLIRAYSSEPGRSAGVLEALAMTPLGDDVWESRGSQRGGTLHYDPPPAGVLAQQGGGSVHHVAWSAADDEELAELRAAVMAAGAAPTPIIDRQYFHSVYFREPSGVLFELATRDVGFDIDEPLETLGEALLLPPQHEHMRARLEKTLTPLPSPGR